MVDNHSNTLGLSSLLGSKHFKDLSHRVFLPSFSFLEDLGKRPMLILSEPLPEIIIALSSWPEVSFI